MITPNSAVSTQAATEPALTAHAPVKIDSSGWTGISKVRIYAGNASAIASLIEEAQRAINSDSNQGVAQARVLLSAARKLTEAPDPPSAIIWDLIQKAGAIVGLLDVFFKIFEAAAS